MDLFDFPYILLSKESTQYCITMNWFTFYLNESKEESKNNS